MVTFSSDLIMPVPLLVAHPVTPKDPMYLLLGMVANADGLD